jgi:hypothetical protein
MTVAVTHERRLESSKIIPSGDAPHFNSGSRSREQVNHPVINHATHHRRGTKCQCRPIRRDLQRMRFRVSNQNLHRRWRRQSGRAAAKGRRNFLNELVEFDGIEIADGPEIDARPTNAEHCIPGPSGSSHWRARCPCGTIFAGGHKRH